MKTLPFFNYRQDIPDSQVLPFDHEKVVPVQLKTPLNQIGIKSTTELYNFLTNNPKRLEVIGKLTGLDEDELARFQEDITQKLEKLDMIDTRCGESVDPCTTLPKNIIQKTPITNSGPTQVLPRKNTKPPVRNNTGQC